VGGVVGGVGTEVTGGVVERDEHLAGAGDVLERAPHLEPPGFDRLLRRERAPVERDRGAVIGREDEIVGSDRATGDDADPRVREGHAVAAPAAFRAVADDLMEGEGDERVVGGECDRADRGRERGDPFGGEEAGHGATVGGIGRSDRGRDGA